MKGLIKMTKGNFCVYSKEEFEDELKSIVNGIGLPIYNIQDITKPLIDKGFNTKERIYKIKTSQANKCIIIYSSIDIRTDRTRDIGSDALRVVIWLRTKQGDFFKSYKKHYRIETLFINLAKSIEEINNKEIASFRGYKKKLQYA
jgi:hypothetical protein